MTTVIGSAMGRLLGVPVAHIEPACGAMTFDSRSLKAESQVDLKAREHPLRPGASRSQPARRRDRNGVEHVRDSSR